MEPPEKPTTTNLIIKKPYEDMIRKGYVNQNEQNGVNSH